jgi:hypothetical protein
MSQTCLMHAAHALHICHLLAICRLNTFHMHTFMHAQANYMQERHKLAAHTLYAHTMYACSTQKTLKLHTCHTHLHHRCHICYMRKYAVGMPKTHTVCMLHANYMPHMHACMPHSYYIYGKHTNVMYNANMYLCTLHACTLYQHMQATCCCMFTSCRMHVNTFMHAH